MSFWPFLTNGGGQKLLVSGHSGHFVAKSILARNKSLSEKDLRS